MLAPALEEDDDAEDELLLELVVVELVLDVLLDEAGALPPLLVPSV